MSSVAVKKNLNSCRFQFICKTKQFWQKSVNCDKTCTMTKLKKKQCMYVSMYVCMYV